MRISMRPRELAAAIAAGALLVAAPLGAQSGQATQDKKPGQEMKAQNTAPAMNATAGDIAANPANYYGKKVTVKAEVEDVLGTQVFLLDEDRLFAWPDVMVITPALSNAVNEDSMVTVTGTVRQFVDADFRREYNWNWWDRLDPDIEVTFRNRPVIVADSVRTAEGAELVRR
jgi:hypothetical protein